MAVILTDMKMPNNCRECRFAIGKGDYRYCTMVVDDDCRMRDVSRNFKERYYDCPMQSVDRLIDEINKKICTDNFFVEKAIAQVTEIIREYCGANMRDKVSE